MADIRFKTLSDPDERAEFPGANLAIVDLGDVTVARAVHQPGWRWSTHIRPQVGGDWCQVRHVGVVLSGRLGILLESGASFEFGQDDVYDIPPGHDGYVVGHEPCVMIEWTGVRSFTGFTAGSRARVLATLLFTDLVSSTKIASEVGDAKWREMLSEHLEAVRGKVEALHGREVNTTGDGILATFSGPAQALACAVEIRRVAERSGLAVRAGVHVGEVEIVGNDVRGITVHAAERIMSLAPPGDILVSSLTASLSSSFEFEDRGTHSLKGIPGDWQLFALATTA